jgi:hypothetical protein
VATQLSIRHSDTHFVNHVTFGMPVLICAIPVDLDKLFKNRSPTSSTFNGESCRVMEMTVDGSIMLVVGILRTKNRWTDRASEMLDVEFQLWRIFWSTGNFDQISIVSSRLRGRLTQSGYVTPPQCTATFSAQET